MYCPHGVCIGFRLMCRGEGPRTPFDFIFHRFPKGALRRAGWGWGCRMGMGMSDGDGDVGAGLVGAGRCTAA